MWATINTDASYSKTHRVGAFAFWIVINGNRFFNAGPLKKTNIESPTVAELMCIVNALSFLQMLQDQGRIPKVIHVRLNTDSLNSIHIITVDKVAMRKYQLETKQLKHVVKKWKSIKRYKWTISCAHIRAHIGTDTKSRYVNEWCDVTAKKHMATILENINKPVVN